MLGDAEVICAFFATEALQICGENATNNHHNNSGLLQLHN